MQENILDRLEEGIVQIFAFLPQIAAGLGILIVGYAIAKMVERGTDAALHRIGFERWMRDGGVSEALERTGTRFDASTVLAKLVFWAVMLLVILLVASALGLTVVSALFGEMLAYIPNVIAAVIILFLGLVLGEFVKDLVLASAGGISGMPTLARAAKAVVVILSVFMALEQLDIAEDIVLVAFIAIVGAASLAAGIAFGLGGRDIAAEIARGWYDRSVAAERFLGSEPEPAERDVTRAGPAEPRDTATRDTPDTGDTTSMS
ncbi:MAG: mechanosensitive ion channel family protein [Longimicrobiales bacterium]